MTTQGSNGFTYFPAADPNGEIRGHAVVMWRENMGPIKPRTYVRLKSSQWADTEGNLLTGSLCDSLNHALVTWRAPLEQAARRDAITAYFRSID